MHTIKSKRQRGFSLIEVLIAVVIMSVGLLGLAMLQIGVVRSSAESKTQSIALNLARDKLEDLVTFKLLNEPTNTCVASNDSYQCISSSGSAETISQGGVSFSRTWVVQRCLPAGTTFTCSTANLTAAQVGTAPRNEYKLVDVFVSWADAQAVTQAVSVKNSISAYQPSDVALIQKKSTKVSSRFARARIYDPSSEAGVIPIAVGGGTESAATNPKPEVVVGTAVVETRFNVLTYSGLNGGAADAQARVETAMVGCTCDFNARPADQDPVTNPTRSKRPTYWNGYRYSSPDNATYVPPAGAAAVAQSSKCDICCRDHFDPSALDAGLAKFSPYVSTHSHYASSTSGAPVVVYPGQYREACRLIRVDGIFRVAADLKNDYFGLLATKELGNSTYYASSSQPDLAAVANYQGFVVDYLDARYTTNSVPANFNVPGSVSVSTIETTRQLNLPTSVTLGPTFTGKLVNTAITGITRANPAVVTHSTTYTDKDGAALPAIPSPAFVNGDRVTIFNVVGMKQVNGGSYIVGNATATTFTLNQVVNGVVTGVNSSAFSAYSSGGVASVNHGKWLHSRGLYVDYLEQDAVDAIAVAKADTACQASTAAMSACVLKLLPFTSVNLTELAGWLSEDTSKAVATNNNYSDSITANDPVRGEVTFVPAAADGATVQVTTSSRQGNTSLLDLGFDAADAISPSDDSRWNDSQTFLINNAAPVNKPGNGQFKVDTNLAVRALYGPNYKTGTQASTSCSTSTGPGTGFLSRYLCDVNNAESTTIAPVDLEDAGLGIPNSMAIVMVGYNYTVSSTSITSGSVTCTDSNGSNPLTFTVSNGDPYERATCANLAITSVTQTPVRGAIGAPAYSGVDGTSTERATISFADLQVNDVIGVTFGAPVTFNPSTCTYSCSKASCSDNGNKYNAVSVCP